MICDLTCRCHAYRGPLVPQHSLCVVQREGKAVSVWVWTHMAAA